MDAGRLQGVAASTACGFSLCLPDELRTFSTSSIGKSGGLPCLAVRHHGKTPGKQRGTRSIIIRSAIAHDLAAVAVAAATVVPVCWIFVNRSQLLAGSSSETNSVLPPAREKTSAPESSASFATGGMTIAELRSAPVAHRLNTATNGEARDAPEAPSAMSKRAGELGEEKWLGQSNHETVMASLASVEDGDVRAAFGVAHPSSSLAWLQQNAGDSSIDSIQTHVDNLAGPKFSGPFIQGWNPMDITSKDKLEPLRSGSSSFANGNGHAELREEDVDNLQPLRGVESATSEIDAPEKDDDVYAGADHQVDKISCGQGTRTELGAPKTEAEGNISNGKSDLSQANGNALLTASKVNGSFKFSPGNGKPMNGAWLSGKEADTQSGKDEDGPNFPPISDIGGTDFNQRRAVIGSVEQNFGYDRRTVVEYEDQARTPKPSSEREREQNGSVNGLAPVASSSTSGRIPITKLSKSKVKIRGKSSSEQLPAISEILPLDKQVHHDFYVKMYEELLQARRLGDCIVLLEEMDTLNMLDSDKIFHANFFKACKQQKATKEAFKFMRLIKRPNLKTYNMLLLICRDARDVDGGLRVLSAAEKAGLKPDVILYTTLISTCAKAGKVDIAFKVFHDMQNAGLAPTIETYGAMIDGCALAGQIAKAFGVYGIMISKKLKPDHAIFNTLIKACGRVGAIERAFDVLADMRAEPCFLTPNHVTVGALISACARVGQVERAFDVYRQMSKWGIKGTAECYTAAVHACSPTGDLDLALSVYEDMKREATSPDEVFFSALIDVAGHSKQIDKAFNVVEEMKKVAVIPGPITYSALMGVCCNTGNWERGLELYKEVRKAKLVPTTSTFNALITALCDAKQIQEAFAVFQEMRDSSVQADQVTYSILLDACEKSGEPEKAFNIYATGRTEGVVPNEAMCASVISVCYANVRKRRSSLRYPCSIGLLGGQSNEVPYERWTGWAIAVFRHAVAANAVPSIKTLSLLLGCLRMPEAQHDKKLFDDALFHPTHSRLRPLPLLDSASFYDPRALGILQEAASIGVVPHLIYTAGPVTMNAESMPSFVAEVYLVSLLKGLKERHMAGAQLFPVTITFSTETTQTMTAGNQRKSITVSGRAGQDLAALLRRLKLHFHGHMSSGKLRIETSSIRKWLKPSASFPALPRHQEVGVLGPPHTFLGQGIAEQQRAIRTGQVFNNSAHKYRNPAKVAKVDWDRGSANNT